jgi:hypothetical protein
MSEDIKKSMALLFTTPAAPEFVSAVGSMITDPILNILEQYSGRDDQDPKEFARAFHGILASITGGASLIDTLGETVSGGQIEGLGRGLQSIYWNLGLGFLGWQTMAPLLSAGLQPGLERYYQRLYRPKRFSAGQLQDLYAMGKITSDKLVADLRTEGWKDEDVTNLIQLSYRQLAQGDIWELLKQGLITEDQAVARLKVLGYDPADIPMLLKINADQYASDAKETTKTTAIQAFREHLIPENELRALLAKLKISANEIDLVVAIEKAKDVQDTRSLTVSQIKAAWTDNVLGDQESAHYLSVAGFTNPDIDIILRSWKAEIIPTFRKLNKGTIINAYIEGILNRSVAIQKLIAVGFQEADAILEVDLAERQNPEIFGLPSTKKSRVLAPGTLASLLVAGLIDADTMYQELLENYYSEEDATYLTMAAEIRRQEQPERLSQLTIERAYIAGVLDRSRAEQELSQIGLDLEQITIILNTVEAENPGIFAPETITSVKLPSITLLVEAVRNGLITELEYYARTAELGYQPIDASLYLAMSTTNERKGTKELSQAQVVNAYGKYLFTRGQAQERLTSMGYSDADAVILLRMERELVIETDAWNSMLAKAITAYDCILQLISGNFKTEEIKSAFASLSDSALISFGTDRATLASVFKDLEAPTTTTEAKQ